MNAENDNKGNRPPAAHEQRSTIDVSAFLLWEDNTDFHQELYEVAERGAPFARARRIQATFAGAEAGGMSEATRLRVLVDWAIVANNYFPMPGLSNAIRLAAAVCEEGPTPEAWEAFQVIEANRARRARDLVGDDATAVLHNALEPYLREANEAHTLRPPTQPVPAGEPKSDGNAAWVFAVDMLAAVASMFGGGAPKALAECEAAMNRRIFTWHSARPALSAAG